MYRTSLVTSLFAVIGLSVAAALAVDDASSLSGKPAKPKTWTERWNQFRQSLTGESTDDKTAEAESKHDAKPAARSGSTSAARSNDSSARSNDSSTANTRAATAAKSTPAASDTVVRSAAIPAVPAKTEAMSSRRTVPSDFSGSGFDTPPAELSTLPTLRSQELRSQEPARTAPNKTSTAKAAGTQTSSTPVVESSSAPGKTVVLSPDLPARIPVSPTPPQAVATDRTDSRPVSVLHRSNALQDKLTSMRNGNDDQEIAAAQSSRSQAASEFPAASNMAPPVNELPRRPLDGDRRKPVASRANEAPAKTPNTERSSVLPDNTAVLPPGHRPAEETVIVDPMPAAPSIDDSTFARAHRARAPGITPSVSPPSATALSPPSAAAVSPPSAAAVSPPSAAAVSPPSATAVSPPSWTGANPTPPWVASEPAASARRSPPTEIEIPKPAESSRRVEPAPSVASPAIVEKPAPISPAQDSPTPIAAEKIMPEYIAPDKIVPDKIAADKIAPADKPVVAAPLPTTEQPAVVAPLPAWVTKGSLKHEPAPPAESSIPEAQPLVAAEPPATVKSPALVEQPVAVEKPAAVVKPPEADKRAKLELSLAGPREVGFGQTMIYQLSLSNPGTADAENIVIHLLPMDNKDAGASHNFGNLAAGELKVVELELVARQLGTVAIRAQAVAQGNLRAEAKQDVQVTRESPLLVTVRAPESMLSGNVATYTIVLKNGNHNPMHRVPLTAQLPAGAKFISASGDAKPSADETKVTWPALSIRGGSEIAVEMKCQLIAPGANRLQAEVFGGSEDKVAGEGVTRVEGIADLKLEVLDPQGTLAVGQEAIYEIHLSNRGTKAAEKIEVRGLFSRGVEPSSAQGIEYEIADGAVNFQPIAKIAPGKEVVLKIRATADRPGQHIFRAEASSSELDQKFAVEQSKIYMDDVTAKGIERTARRPTAPEPTPAPIQK